MKTWVKLVLALAIRQSRKIEWLEIRKSFLDPIQIQTWQIIRTGQVLFEGLPVNLEGIRNYVDYKGQDELGKESLPPCFNSFLKREGNGDSEQSSVARLLNSFHFVTKVVIALSFAANIERCASMPIILNERRLKSWFNPVNKLFKKGDFAIRLYVSTCVIAVVGLLVTIKHTDMGRMGFHVWRW